MSDYSDRLAEPDADLREALLRRYGRVRPDSARPRLTNCRNYGMCWWATCRWSGRARRCPAK
ncbi:MAG: hypothetical protein U1F70_13065 [Candidatus Competibacteraceae bacterium]